MQNPCSAKRFRARPVTTAISNLVAEGIVDETPGYFNSYRLTTQLYVRWLKLYHPLQKTIKSEVHDGGFTDQ